MAFWNVIFPSKCKICENPFIFKDQNLYCPSCISAIEKTEIYFCRSCGITVESGYTVCDNCKKDRIYNQIEAFTDYYKVGEIIRDYKLGGYKNLHKVLSQMIKEDLLSFIKENKVETVLYIPLHPSTLKKRGFNHLRLILEDIVPSFMIKDWIIKERKTKFQMELSAEERQKNLTDAFSLKEEAKFYGQNVLVFDDILTTGSTLKEVAKLLKNQNIGKIFGYVVAKT
ncbi:MAG: double zinc ribbon domain-containing protein [Hydrogenothermaceae bacterium]|nr:double zinc ribbon domain-containing protein [Hydrogenothermaceae bacterium]